MPYTPKILNKHSPRTKDTLSRKDRIGFMMQGIGFVLTFTTIFFAYKGLSLNSSSFENTVKRQMISDSTNRIADLKIDSTQHVKDSIQTERWREEQSKSDLTYKLQALSVSQQLGNSLKSIGFQDRLMLNRDRYDKQIEIYQKTYEAITTMLLKPNHGQDYYLAKNSIYNNLYFTIQLYNGKKILPMLDSFNLASTRMELATSTAAIFDSIIIIDNLFRNEVDSRTTSTYEGKNVRLIINDSTIIDSTLKYLEISNRLISEYEKIPFVNYPVFLGLFGESDFGNQLQQVTDYSSIFRNYSENAVNSFNDLLKSFREKGKAKTSIQKYEEPYTSSDPNHANYTKAYRLYSIYYSNPYENYLQPIVDYLRKIMLDSSSKMSYWSQMIKNKMIDEIPVLKGQN